MTFQPKYSYWLLALLVFASSAALLHYQRKSLTVVIYEGIEGEALKRVALEFSNQKKVTVDVVQYPYDELRKHQLEQVKRPDSQFDVFMLDDPWMPALLEPQIKLIEVRPACDDLADFVPTTLRVAGLPQDFAEPACKYKFDTSGKSSVVPKHLYALPFVGNVQLFAYRRSAVSKPPSTWQNVIQIADQQRKQDGRTAYAVRVGPGNRIVTDFMPILWSASAQSFRETDPKPALEPDALLAFERLSLLGGNQVNAGKTQPSSNASNNSKTNPGIVSFDDFDLAIQLAKGTVSMSIVWSAWMMAMLQVPEPQLSELLNEIEFSRMPDETIELGTWLLAIPVNVRRERLTLAQEFLAFATDKDRMWSAVSAGNPPTRASVWKKLKDNPDSVFQSINENAWKQKKIVKIFEDQLYSLEHARPRPRTPYWSEIETALGESLWQVYSGLKAEEGLERARREILPVSRMAHPPKTNLS